MNAFLDFAIANRTFLFRLDAAACFVIALAGIYLMQIVPRVADHRSLLGTPWPRGLEHIVRLTLAIGSGAAFLVPAQYWAGRVHFVLVEEVAFHVALAVLGIVMALFRKHIFGRYADL